MVAHQTAEAAQLQGSNPARLTGNNPDDTQPGSLCATVKSQSKRLYWSFEFTTITHWQQKQNLSTSKIFANSATPHSRQQAEAESTTDHSKKNKYYFIAWLQ